MALDPEKIEGRLDRAVVAGTEVSMGIGGGVKFQTMVELMEFARLLSLSGAAVPPHLRNNPGAALAICTRALRFNFDPFALAEHSYIVTNKGVETMAFDSFVLHAIIESSAPIKGRLRASYTGEGETRRCIVTGFPRGESDPLIHEGPTLGDLIKARGRNEYGKIKGSPLYETKPDQQLWYDARRDWCRKFYPDILLGWYDKDEFEENKPENAKDITPDIASRLKGGGGQGFSAEHVETQTGGRRGKTKAIPQAVPQETIPEAKVVETVQVAREAHGGAGPSEKVKDAKALPIAATAVQDAPKEDPRPSDEETPMQRGNRLLSICKTKADVSDLRSTIADELTAQESKEWHMLCDAKAGAVK